MVEAWCSRWLAPRRRKLLFALAQLRQRSPQPDAAPQLGDWVGECSFTPGGATDNCVWAPEVTEVAGGYALYYTARDATSGRQCIGVSTSASPDGPDPGLRFSGSPIGRTPAIRRARAGARLPLRI